MASQFEGDIHFLDLDIQSRAILLEVFQEGERGLPLWLVVALRELGAVSVTLAANAQGIKTLSVLRVIQHAFAMSDGLKYHPELAGRGQHPFQRFGFTNVRAERSGLFHGEAEQPAFQRHAARGNRKRRPQTLATELRKGQIFIQKRTVLSHPSIPA
ncbi:hypothetical protein [uncultured Desulfovibrio sp.]|uniref:hypothetical protein n=1 Tax=uncultured Desulfovibrio sp. TaxID=167968 RepID=UPI002635C169|nr:hypothetical protein [uncultured Desulfovibrio sp.]